MSTGISRGQEGEIQTKIRKAGQSQVLKGFQSLVRV